MKNNDLLRAYVRERNPEKRAELKRDYFGGEDETKPLDLPAGLVDELRAEQRGVKLWDQRYPGLAVPDGFFVKTDSAGLLTLVSIATGIETFVVRDDVELSIEFATMRDEKHQTESNAAAADSDFLTSADGV